MTKYFYNTETGQTDGTTVSTALLPANGVSPTLTTSGTFTVQFKTAAAAQGALGIRSTATVSGASVQIRFGASPTFSTADMQWDGTLNVAAYPSGPTRFFGLYSGGFTTFIGGLSMDATGHILVLNQPGSTVYTSTAVVPTGTTIRWNLRLRQGSTTSNGIIDFSYYATYAATSPTETMTQITNANLSTFALNPITNAIKGKVTTTGTWSQWDMDADQFSTSPSTDGLITGPYFATLPVAGSVAAVSAAAGSVSSLLAAVGSAAATSATSGSVSLRASTAGVAGAVSGVAGAVEVLPGASLLPVAGVTAAVSASAGAVAVRAAVSGLASAGSAAVGSVSTASPVAGVAVATSTAAGTVLNLGPPVDITVTAVLSARRWSAGLTPKGITATLPDRRAEALLPTRRISAALTEARWKGSLL